MKKGSFPGVLCILLVLAALPVAIPAAAGSAESLLLNEKTGEVVSGLEGHIPVLMEKARIPGLQIALIRDGEVAWEGGFGIRSTETEAPVTTETIFEAASLTKPFFAYAIMKMVDEGLIDLDRPLIEYLPREAIEQRFGHSLDADGFHGEWFERITARHALSHSSGMPHGEGGEIYPLFFEPGTKWKYSADGYFFLQQVVQLVKGKGLVEVMDEYVLTPLGMERSWMVWREEYEETMANGHGLFGDPGDYRRRTEPHAAATLFTTAGEYARFVCAVLNGEGLRPETAKEMLTSFIVMNEEQGLDWSLGFGLQKDENGTAIWQWGDYGIFRNYVIAYPEQRAGVVYLANSFNGLAVCSGLVGRSLGGRALGCEALEYLQYDSPAYSFLWDLKERGSVAAREELPGLIKEYPDVFTRERVSGFGQLLEQDRMYEEAAAVHRCNHDAHPRSGETILDLARATLLTGDAAGAKKLYREALEAPEDSGETATVDWAMDYIKAIEEPARLEEARMRKIAGDYGSRHIIVEEGSLHYFRDDNEPRPLLAISDDTFVIEGVTYFKMRIEFDAVGNPTKILGIYENGYRDESPRTE